MLRPEGDIDVVRGSNMQMGRLKKEERHNAGGKDASSELGRGVSEEYPQ